jgi:hypothetical protein
LRVTVRKSSDQYGLTVSGATTEALAASATVWAAPRDGLNALRTHATNTAAPPRTLCPIERHRMRGGNRKRVISNGSVRGEGSARRNAAPDQR